MTIPVSSFPQQPMDGSNQTIDIPNAGLVLLNTHLQMLFNMCGYLNQHKFKDTVAANRAAHLLQFLATGEENTTDQGMAFNKLLCGIPVTQSTEEPVVLLDNEKELCLRLLRSAISSWAILNNISVDGLREAFLIRNGRLDLSATDSVKLNVERHHLDLLIDRLPWDYTNICFPWMPLELRTEWR